MMAEWPRTPSLNKKQVEVLQWIRSGCAADIFTSGYEHRIIARRSNDEV